MVRANRELPKESVAGRCPQGSTYAFFARILGVLNSCQCSVSAKSFWLESQEYYFPWCHFPAWCQGRVPWSHQVGQTWKWPPGPLTCLGQADSHLGPEWQSKLSLTSILVLTFPHPIIKFSPTPLCTGFGLRKDSSGPVPEALPPEGWKLFGFET